jgi:hypothetical protein
LETREELVETRKEAERCAESDVPAGVDGEFVPLLNWVPGEVFDNIFLEVDEEDEEILNRIAEAEEFSRGLWDDWVKNRPADMQFADPATRTALLLFNVNGETQRRCLPSEVNCRERGNMVVLA